MAASGPLITFGSSSGQNRRSTVTSATTDIATDVSVPQPGEPAPPLPWLEEMPPRQIVAELDRYIVGQEAAKKAVAIAVRNRWRRAQAPDDIR